MSRILIENAAANYLGAAVGVAAPLLALPYYIHAMGDSHWGLIAFVLTLQAMMTILDSGMGQSLVRFFSLGFHNESYQGHSPSALFARFEECYWIAAITLGALLFVAATYLTDNWLHLDAEHQSDGVLAVRGAAALCMVQVPGMLYRSVIVAAQAQVKLNVIVAISMVIRHGGGVLVVLLIPSMLAYLVWHFLSMTLETMIRRNVAWRLVGGVRRGDSLSFWELRPILSDMSILAVAGVMGGLVTVVDKLLLSSLVSVVDFGRYAVASQLAYGALLLIYPLTTAILPRLTRLADQPARLFRFNLRLLSVVTALCVVGGSIFSLVGYGVLGYWLNRDAALEVVYPTVCVMLVGVMFNALYNVGYLNWLATGKSAKVFKVHAAGLVLMVILVPVLVEKMGPIGAAWAWVVVSAGFMVASFDWVLIANAKE